MGKFKSGGNPYHDPKTGRFTDAAGAGAVFDPSAYYAARTGGDVNKIRANLERNMRIRASLTRVDRVKSANARSERIRSAK